MNDLSPIVNKSIVRKLALSWIAIAVFVSACNNDRGNSGIHENKVLLSGNTAVEDGPNELNRITGYGPVSSSAQPLQDAFHLLNLDSDDLIRRPAFEDGYLMLARLPLIDFLSHSPFTLQHWANDVSDALQTGASDRLCDTFRVLVSELRGVATDGSYSRDPVQLRSNLVDAYRYLCQTFGWSPEGSALQKIKNLELNPLFDQQIGLLVHRIADATLLAVDAYSELSAREQEYIASRPERFFFPQDEQFRFLTAPSHVQVEIVSIARKVKFDRLFEAFARVAYALDEFRQQVSHDDKGNPVAPEYFTDGQVRSGVLLTMPSPIGDIVILGQDDNDFQGSAAILIDIGGNDRYTGTVASGMSLNGRVSIWVDIAGDDTYADGHSRLNQGVGVASIGLLADFDGNDRYVAGDMAQGCGLFGIGVLLDSRGDDSYEMGLMGQGFGVFGLGMLVDRSGSDHYVIGGMGQGLGSTMGFGALVDNGGDDEYRAGGIPGKGPLKPDNWSHAQGVGISVRSPDWHRSFSLYGGIGLLSDGSGDDAYYCSDGNCMGAGYFMSVGSLVDHSGDDRYVPENGNGMGFAVHHASGILIDREGDDQYFAKTDSGGVGADRSVGVLVDYQGDDTYGPVWSNVSEAKRAHRRGADFYPVDFLKASNDELAGSSYASASRSKGLGILIDGSGNDRYFAKEDIRSASCGAVIPPPDPNYWGHALLIDLGGTDFHNSADRQNNSYRIDLHHGLFYDVDLTDGEKAIERFQPIPAPGPKGGQQLPAASMAENLEKDLTALIGEDNFRRFASIGHVVQSEPEVINSLINVLGVSCQEEFNRSVIEVLNHFILRKEMNRERTRHFEGLLRACDPEVRIYAARTLGWWNVAHSADAVISAMDEPNPQVRANVFWAVGRLGRLETLFALSRAISAEKSSPCKIAAIRAYHDILAANAIDGQDVRQNVQQELLVWAGDPDPIVRREAAAGLRYIGSKNEAIVQMLTALLMDDDIYVRRISAISLAYLGQSAGLPVLIDSLRFPSIDTRAYYDHDLVKDIAYFSGTDFPEEKRYDYKTWKDWWDQNSRNIDVEENLAIREKIETAFEKIDETDGLLILDRLLEQYPDNTVVKLRVIRFCNDWMTYRLLSGESIGPDIIERCLRLQKKIVEIEPENPKAISKLAGFYARLGRFDDAAAAMKMATRLDPDNKQYRQSLRQYETVSIGNQ